MNRRNMLLCALCACLTAFLAVPALAHGQAWKTAQASVYGGPNEPWETTTAIGTRITSNTDGIAVPYQQVVSKKTWRKLSDKMKSKRFYYGEVVYFKRKVGKKTYTSRAVVRDCGGFLNYGARVNGKWVPRQFDLQPRIKRELHVNGLGIVKWKWAE